MRNYLLIDREHLGDGSPIGLSILPTNEDVFEAMAEEMFSYIQQAHESGKTVCMVVPVGPIGQYEILAQKCNERRVSCKNVVFINMDEYCDVNGEWVAEEDPISFRGFMKRGFFALLDEANRPLAENCLFPDPHDLAAIERKVAEVGGIDVVFGGLGINGHVAFNEPEPALSVEKYYRLPTRVMDLNPDTRLINAAFGAGGNVEAMPPKCVTIGFREIFSARRISLYCFRPWQAAVVRKALHGPITTHCPVSMLQHHPNTSITISEVVARVPVPSV